MAELLKVELEMDEQCHGALCGEAKRLGITASEVVHRAVAAWLGDTADDYPQGWDEAAAAR